VVLAIGVNDFCRDRVNQAEMTGRITRLARALPRHVPLLWSSILPLETVLSRCGASPQDVRRANAMIARACAAIPACVYSDGYALMADAQGERQAQYDIGDGLHLSARGYETWMALLTTDLAKATAKRGLGAANGN
jgi:lysophospholipase L1-like esterase